MEGLFVLTFLEDVFNLLFHQLFRNVKWRMGEYLIIQFQLIPNDLEYQWHHQL